MIIFFFLYISFSGFLSFYSEYKDIFSISSSQVVAESNTWKLHVPEKYGFSPYFTYEGETPSIYPYIVGIVYYNTKDNSEMKAEGKDGYGFKDNHFIYGEKRWILSEYCDKKIIKACFKLNWEENGKYYSEYVYSEDLSKEEKKKAEKWIAKYDEEYTLPFTWETVVKKSN